MPVQACREAKGTQFVTTSEAGPGIYAQIAENKRKIILDTNTLISYYGFVLR